MGPAQVLYPFFDVNVYLITESIFDLESAEI